MVIPCLGCAAPVQAVGRLDHVGAALGDHHDPRVAVARRHGGHDARVGDPQALDAVDAQLGVDDGHVVEAHAARAGLVVVRVGLVASRSVQLVVGLRRPGPGISSSPTHAAEGLRREELARELDALDQPVAVGCAPR